MTKKIKKVLLDVIGALLIILGILLSPVPGPGGLPIILAGLGILAIHNDWAKKLLDNFEDRFNETKNVIKHANNKTKNLIDIGVVLLVIVIIILVTIGTKLTYGLSLGLFITTTLLFLTNRDRFNKIKNKRY